MKAIFRTYLKLFASTLCIAAFNGSHVEVVTRVYSDFLGRQAFCSRGGYRNPISTEECGSAILSFWRSDRLVNEDNIRFLTVK